MTNPLITTPAQTEDAIADFFNAATITVAGLLALLTVAVTF
jgi:hypothetical protein